MQFQVFWLVCGVNVMSQSTSLEGYFKFLLGLGPLGFVLKDWKVLDIWSCVLAENLQLVVSLMVKFHKMDDRLSRLKVGSPIQFEFRILDVTRQVDHCSVVFVKLLKLR